MSSSRNMLFDLPTCFIDDNEELHRLHPLQVEYRAFPPFNAILKNREHTVLKIIKPPMFDENVKYIEYAKVPKKMQTRFIELLPTSTMLLLPYTSKAMYAACLNVRGFNCEAVEQKHETKAIFEYKQNFSYNGYLFDVMTMENPEWIRFFVFNTRLQFRSAIFVRERCTFVKKYKVLEMYIDKHTEDCLRDMSIALIHPGIESFHLIVGDDIRNATPGNIEEQFPVTFENFQFLLEKLSACTFLKHFRCRFVGDIVQFAERPTMTSIKDCIELWYSEKRMCLDVFYMYYNYAFFLLADGKLMKATDGTRTSFNQFQLIPVDDTENAVPDSNADYKKPFHNPAIIRKRTYNDFYLV